MYDTFKSDGNTFFYQHHLDDDATNMSIEVWVKYGKDTNNPGLTWYGIWSSSVDSQDSLVEAAYQFKDVYLTQHRPITLHSER